MVSSFWTGKLHKAESVLFRCTKIRKSKGCDGGRVRLKRPRPWGIKTLLPSMAAKHYAGTGRLKIYRFLPKITKAVSGFVLQVASRWCDRF